MADETAVATARPEPGSDAGTGASWAVAGLLLVALAGGIQHYRLDRDVDSLKERAQLAANPGDMLTYLRALDANMVAHGATTGHTALLLKTPANDLSLHTRSVRSVIARLEQVQRLPPDAAAYQAALDDVRGVLREMPAIAGGLFWVQSGWWMSLVAFVCLVRLASD